MFLSFNMQAQRLLSDPAHKPVVELIVALVDASLRATYDEILFPPEGRSEADKAVALAEARILRSFQQDLASASRLAPGPASPPAQASGNSPGGS